MKGLCSIGLERGIKEVSKNCQRIVKELSNFIRIYIGGESSILFILIFFTFTVANVDYFSDVLLISINH